MLPERVEACCVLLTYRDVGCSIDHAADDGRCGPGDSGPRFGANQAATAATVPALWALQSSEH